MAQKKLPGRGTGSSHYLSPRNPQTGNGKTTRDIFDVVRLVFRTADGKKVPRSKPGKGGGK